MIVPTISKPASSSDITFGFLPDLGPAYSNDNNAKIEVPSKIEIKVLICDLGISVLSETIPKS